MKAIGIRELKAGLSRYLRDVAAGEVVLVTDRGRVVAELRAPGDTPVHETDHERRLRIMAAQIPLTIGKPHNPGTYQPSAVRLKSGTAKELLDFERDERDRLR